MYIDILLRWNARINLTAVRDTQQIVTRHFGESLFAARHLLPLSAKRLADVGSGAGFPGLPIKIWQPEVRLTLIESNHKKATFLREVARVLTFMDIDVYCGRAEDFPAGSPDIVTLRAVERFDSALPYAARLVAPGGRLGLLLGEAQASRVAAVCPEFSWQEPIPIPLSTSRVILIGGRGGTIEVTSGINTSLSRA